MHLSYYMYLKVAGTLGDALLGRQLERALLQLRDQKLPAHSLSLSTWHKRLQSNPKEITTWRLWRGWNGDRVPGRKCLKVGRGCSWGKGTLSAKYDYTVTETIWCLCAWILSCRLHSVGTVGDCSQPFSSISRLAASCRWGYPASNLSLATLNLWPCSV